MTRFQCATVGELRDALARVPESTLVRCEATIPDSLWRGKGVRTIAGDLVTVAVGSGCVIIVGKDPTTWAESVPAPQPLSKRMYTRRKR